jgi:1,4-alpha-glucan branching enzyme
MDGTNYIRTIDNDWRELPDGWSLMQWINDEAHWAFPWKLTIAEDMQGNPSITAGTGLGGAGFDTQWDARFVHPVRETLAAIWDEERDLRRIEAAIYHRYGADAFRRVIYTESHDESGGASGKPRLPEDVHPGHPDGWAAKKRTTLGAALVMTSSGIPMIFQGQEFLAGGTFTDDRPLDWGRRERYAGLVNLYRDLVRLHRNWHDTTRCLRGQHVHIFHRNSQPSASDSLYHARYRQPKDRRGRSALVVT